MVIFLYHVRHSTNDSVLFFIFNLSFGHSYYLLCVLSRVNFIRITGYFNNNMIIPTSIASTKVYHSYNILTPMTDRLCVPIQYNNSMSTLRCFTPLCRRIPLKTPVVRRTEDVYRNVSIPLPPPHVLIYSP